MDLSSKGVLFDAGRPLPAGSGIEISIAWPALLHDVAPMRLVVTGRVVRSEDAGRVAVQVSQHEFRTAPALEPLARVTRTGTNGIRLTGTAKVSVL